MHDKIVNDYMTDLELDYSAGQVDERGQFRNLHWEAGVTKWARGNNYMRVQEGDWFIAGVDLEVVAKHTLGESPRAMGPHKFASRFPGVSPSLML